MEAAKCDHCGKELIPARAKLRADGEQTYCGYYQCPCNRAIMTDFGVVYPGSEEHDYLISTGSYRVNDVLGEPPPQKLKIER